MGLVKRYFIMVVILHILLLKLQLWFTSFKIPVDIRFYSKSGHKTCIQGVCDSFGESITGYTVEELGELR